MPPSAITFDMEKCGAVPNIVDTIQIAMIRAYEARPGGFRISQFPNKKIFYDWVKSGKSFAYSVKLSLEYVYC